MSGKYLFFAFGIIGAALLPIRGKAETLRVCATEELSQYREVDDDELDAHRQFTLPSLSYDYGKHKGKEWGFNVTLRIDQSGKPTCISMYSLADASNKRRQDIIQNASNWRYKPFVRDGVATVLQVDETIREEEKPGRFIPMPQYGSSDVLIELSRSACFGTCPAYSVSLRGDGTVTYNGRAFVAVPGKHVYQVPEEDVVRLLETARQTDIWSMRSAYVADVTDSPHYHFSIRIGGKTKAIADYVGEYVGMPKVISDFEDLIDKVARTDAWITLSGETIDRLKKEGFAFKSQAGADLLAGAINDDDQEDDKAVLTLMEVGAPLTGGRVFNYSREDGRDIDLLEAAISNGRIPIMEALLARNVLLKDGVVDQARIDRAFQAAIGHGKMKVVMTMWAWHPDLTYQDEVRFPQEGQPSVKTVPVTLRLDSQYTDRSWEGFDIAKFLLGQGCDINASDTKGNTLLHIAAGGDSVEFVRYLIERGAKLKVLDNMGNAPLDSAINEDVAIALLEAGADPTNKPEYGYTVAEEARLYNKKKILAWLLKHGIMAPYANPNGA